MGDDLERVSKDEELEPVSMDEIEAEGATALPNKEVMSLLDVNANVDLGLDLAAPVDLAAHRITVVVREAVDEPCTDAATTMGTLLAAVANGPSGSPPEPATMGYAPDAADGEPAPCAVASARQPGECRAPRPAEVPLDPTALLRSAATPAAELARSASRASARRRWA